MMRYGLVVLALAGLLWGVPTYCRAASPQEQVRTSVDRVIDTLKDKSLTGKPRRERLTSIIRPRFDFRVMSRWVLGVQWRRATEPQKQRFTELFSDLLEATYIGKIENYTDERVEYGEERIEGDRALVETKVVTKSAEIPIDYKLLREGEEWRVYDVVIENVSLVRNYRSTYDEIARKEGIDALLGRMEEKLAELRSAEGSAEGNKP
jgi:phospholipid transport system substrate-binding protein